MSYNNLYKYRNKIIIDNSNNKLLCYVNCIATRNHDHQLNNSNNNIDEQLKTKINDYDNKILLNVKLNLNKFVDSVSDSDKFINLFTLTQKKIMNFFFIYFDNNNNNNTKLLLRKKYNQNNTNNKFNYLLNNNENLKYIYDDLLDSKGNDLFNTTLISKLESFEISDSSVYYKDPILDDGTDISNNKLSNQSLILFNFNNRFNNSNYFELSILKEYSDYIKKIGQDINNCQYTSTNLTNNFNNYLLITLNDALPPTTKQINSSFDFDTSSVYLYTRPMDNPVNNNTNYLRFTSNSTSKNFDVNFNIINTGYNENKIYFIDTSYNNNNISKNTLFITGKLLKKNDYGLMEENKKKIFLSFGNGICGINSKSLCNNLHLGYRTKKRFIFTDISNVIRLINPNFVSDLSIDFQLNHNEYYVNNFLYNKTKSLIKVFEEDLNNFYDISYTPFLKKDINIINQNHENVELFYIKNDILNVDDIREVININNSDINYDFRFNYNKSAKLILNILVKLHTENIFTYSFNLTNNIFIINGSDFKNVNCIFVYNGINEGTDNEYKYPNNNIDICNNPTIDTISRAILQLQFEGDRKLKNYSIIPELNNNNLTKKQIYSYIATNNIPKLLSIIPKDNSTFTVGRDEGLNLGSSSPLVCNNDEESQRKKLKEIYKNKYNENNKTNNNTLNRRNYAKLVRASNNVRKKLLECNNF